MAGLLDAFNSGDEGLLTALAIMNAGRAQPVRQSLAGGLLEGMQVGQQARNSREDREMRRKQFDMQMAEMQAQQQHRAAQAQEQQRRAQEAARVQSLLQQQFSPVRGIQANAASGVTGPRPEALGVVGQMPQVNYQHLIAQGVPPEVAKALAEARNYGRDKVARTVEVRGPDGTPMLQREDDYGGVVGQNTAKPFEMRLENMGGHTEAVNPFALLPGQRFQRTMTPDGAAADARARQRLALDQQQPKGQYDAERGLMIDPRTGTARPVTQDGQPIGGKQPESVRKELMSINQQRSLIDGAIQAVKTTPSAFGMARGMATMAGAIPESVAGRLDSDKERQARAFVFNNVSAVINERAGAAQSAQELARLRGFLPAETDNAEQVVSKFEAFKTYLADKERGTTGRPSPASQPSLDDLLRKYGN